MKGWWLGHHLWVKALTPNPHTQTVISVAVKLTHERTKIADNLPFRSYILGYQVLVDRETVTTSSLPPSLGSPSTGDFEERPSSILIR